MDTFEIRALNKAKGAPQTNWQQHSADDVFLHDDIPRVNCKYEVTESLVRGNDGLTQAASVCTSTGKIAHPITRLYPLEVVPHSVTKTDDSSSDSARESVSLPSQQMITEQPRIGPLRVAATRAHKQLSNLSVILQVPPEGRCKLTDIVIVLLGSFRSHDCSYL